MSRIITELKCDACSHKWEGYKSFGHPEKTFNYVWKCAKCGSQNSYTVEEWIKSEGSQNNVIVNLHDAVSFVRIFSFDKDSNAYAFPLISFVWKKFNDEESNDFLGGWLSLEDISDQIMQMRSKEHRNDCSIIHVWVEGPLYGTIYQFGSYDETTWRLHSKTKGYA